MKKERFMKKTMIICALSIFFAACGGGNTEKAAEATGETTEKPTIEDYDPNRGEGKFHEVAIGATLDKPMSVEGEKTAEMKCLSCHKLSDERLVGPGWAGVTTRHQPDTQGSHGIPGGLALPIQRPVALPGHGPGKCPGLIDAQSSSSGRGTGTVSAASAASPHPPTRPTS